MEIVRVIECFTFRDIFYEILGKAKLARVTKSFIIHFIVITQK